MYELDSRSLTLVGNDCSSICQDQDEFSEPLGPLIQKYRDLGQQLKELSHIIQASGRSQQYYQDQQLVKHVREAKADLEKHFDGRAGRSWLKPRRTNRLKDDKIEKLDRQVDEHIRVARDFKTGFLLDTRHMRLEALIGKLVEAGATNSQLSAFDGLTKSSNNLLASPIVSESGQPIPVNTKVENNKTNHLADDFSGALKLARVVWKGRADIAHQHQVHQSQHITGHDSAKRKFINDVVTLIEETRLYTADVDVADNDPQKVLDRLIEIVSKAVQLKHPVGSPAIPALDNNSPQSTSATREMSTSLPSTENFVVQTTAPSEPPEPPSWAVLELSPAARSQVEWDWPQEYEIFLNDDTLNNEEVFNGDSVHREQSQKACHQDNTSSSLSEADFVQKLDIAAGMSCHGPRVKASSYTNASPLHRSPLGDWVKIFIPQIMLQPAFCSLEIDKARGEAMIETTMIPRRESTSSCQDNESFGSRNSTLGSASSGDKRDSQLTYSTRITHFFQERPRSIPSIKHPNYEGPAVSVEKPYTIRFRGTQALKGEGSLDRLQSVSDLEYIFSRREQRDETLSLIFGKTLQASAGVKKIEFGTIVCLREALNLWYDAGTKCSTITFLRGVKDQRSETLTAVEYEIIGIEQCEQAACDDLPIVVYVKSPSDRPHKRQRCSIYFSESSGRAKFMDVLQPP